jgi:hypothetical protein
LPHETTTDGPHDPVIPHTIPFITQDDPYLARLKAGADPSAGADSETEDDCVMHQSKRARGSKFIDAEARDSDADSDDEPPLSCPVDTIQRNLCVGCGVDMGACNPRQYCCKTYCPRMHTYDEEEDLGDDPMNDPSA